MKKIIFTLLSVACLAFTTSATSTVSLGDNDPIEIKELHIKINVGESKTKNGSETRKFEIVGTGEIIELEINSEKSLTEGTLFLHEDGSIQSNEGVVLGTAKNFSKEDYSKLEKDVMEHTRVHE